MMAVKQTAMEVHPFLDSAVIENLSNGVDETLQCMAQVTTSFEKSFAETNWKAPGDVSVFLELQSPPSFGQVRFHFSRKVMIQLYQSMMGETGEPAMQELTDCLGEFSNVCYGYAKGKLNLEGYAFGMTLPHPGKTEDMPALVSKHPHMVIPFKIFNETCYIQIVVF